MNGQRRGCYFCRASAAQSQVTVFKYKAKKHYRRSTGHRQPLSKILITKIAA